MLPVGELCSASSPVALVWLRWLGLLLAFARSRVRAGGGRPGRAMIMQPGGKPDFCLLQALSESQSPSFFFFSNCNFVEHRTVSIVLTYRSEHARRVHA